MNILDIKYELERVNKRLAVLEEQVGAVQEAAEMLRAFIAEVLQLPEVTSDSPTDPSSGSNSGVSNLNTPFDGRSQPLSSVGSTQDPRPINSTSGYTEVSPVELVVGVDIDCDGNPLSPPSGRGRPRKYKNEAERRAARAAYQKKYLADHPEQYAKLKERNKANALRTYHKKRALLVGAEVKWKVEPKESFEKAFAGVVYDPRGPKNGGGDD